MQNPKYFVNLWDILKCIGTGTRSYQEGGRVFNAKHVIYCGLRADYLKEKQFLALLSAIAHVQQAL